MPDITILTKDDVLGKSNVPKDIKDEVLDLLAEAMNMTLRASNLISNHIDTVKPVILHSFVDQAYHNLWYARAVFKDLSEREKEQGVNDEYN